MSNAAIARRLFVTERTVQAHTTQIFHKLGLRADADSPPPGARGRRLPPARFPSPRWRGRRWRRLNLATPAGAPEVYLTATRLQPRRTDDCCGAVRATVPR